MDYIPPERRPHLRVEVKVKNNRIISFREDLQLSPREMAEAIGVAYGTYLNYEGLKVTPLSYGRKGGPCIRKTAQAIADFHGVGVDELWPDEMALLENHAATTFFEINLADAKALGAASMESRELKRVISQALRALTPRQERVIRATLMEDKSLVEMGEEMGVTRTRINQIQRAGLRKLRHPSLSNRIRTFLARAEHPLTGYIRSPAPEFTEGSLRGVTEGTPSLVETKEGLRPSYRETSIFVDREDPLEVGLRLFGEDLGFQDGVVFQCTEIPTGKTIYIHRTAMDQSTHLQHMNTRAYKSVFPVLSDQAQKAMQALFHNPRNLIKTGKMVRGVFFNSSLSGFEEIVKALPERIIDPRRLRFERKHLREREREAIDLINLQAAKLHKTRADNYNKRMNSWKRGAEVRCARRLLHDNPRLLRDNPIDEPTLWGGIPWDKETKVKDLYMRVHLPVEIASVLPLTESSQLVVDYARGHWQVLRNVLKCELFPNGAVFDSTEGLLHAVCNIPLKDQRKDAHILRDSEGSVRIHFGPITLSLGDFGYGPALHFELDTPSASFGYILIMNSLIATMEGEPAVVFFDRKIPPYELKDKCMVCQADALTT